MNLSRRQTAAPGAQRQVDSHRVMQSETRQRSASALPVEEVSDPLLEQIDAAFQVDTMSLPDDEP